MEHKLSAAKFEIEKIEPVAQTTGDDAQGGGQPDAGRALGTRERAAG